MSVSSIEHDFVDEKKVTPSMLSSLKLIRASLLCPICNTIMKDPSTLGCAHSFCQECISNHDTWDCPWPGCNMPVSNRGNKRSYISTNPQLTSVVNALTNITNALGKARVEWWKSTPNGTSMISSSSPEQDTRGINKSMVSFFLPTLTERKEAEEKMNSFESEDIVDLQPDLNNTGNSQEFELKGKQNGVESTTISTPSQWRTGTTSTINVSNEEQKALSECSTPSPWKRAKLSISSNNESLPKLKGKSRENVTNDYSIEKVGTKIDIDGIQFNNNNNKNINDAEENESIVTQKHLLLHEMNELEDNQSPSSQFVCVEDDGDKLGTNKTGIPQKNKRKLGDFDLSTSPPQSHDMNDSGRLNQSCVIPSTCPNVSPIAIMQSQNVDPISPVAAIKQNHFIPRSGVEENINDLGKDIWNEKSKKLPLQKANPPPENNKTTQAQVIKPMIGTKIIPKVSFDGPIALLISSPEELSAADTRAIKKCLKKKSFAMLHPPENDSPNELKFLFDLESKEGINAFLSNMSDANVVKRCFAISHDADCLAPEGLIVKRSFRYLLALASGMRIIDAGFVRDVSSDPSSLAPTLFPDLRIEQQKQDTKRSRIRASNREKDRGKKEKGLPCKYNVIGDIESANCMSMAPQKAREACIKRISDEGLVGNGLLKDYSFMLFGKFEDVKSTEKKTNNSRKNNRGTHSTEESSISKYATNDNCLYSRSKLTLLIRLCSGEIMEEDISDIVGTYLKKRKNIIVLLGDDPSQSYRKDAMDVLKRAKSNKDIFDNIPIVNYKWLLDSISEFSMKGFEKYT
mmetsp:Transcript_131/g.179  ORF Transcript_131/g.179 Transcript_131/m.179 type:complete len:801 (-) Transcript_131:75-2477(-)